MISNSSRIAVFLALLTLLSLVLSGAAAAAPQVAVEEVTYDGPGVVPTDGYDGNVTYLWESKEVVFNVTVSTTADMPYRLCAYNGDGKSGQEEPLDCHSGTLEANQTEAVQLRSAALPNASTEQRNLSFVMTQSINGDASATHTETVRIIKQSGDVDNDGLSNAKEIEFGTILTDVDTDGDGLNDGPEVNSYGTSPLSPDTDGDGLRDPQEVNMGTNATKFDTDGDGLGDGREQELGTDPTNADSDGDGLDDGREQELGTDPLNADSDADGDGLSDVEEVALGTDPHDTDTDSDLLNDGLERRLGTNPNNGVPMYVFAIAVMGVTVIWYHRTDQSLLSAMRQRVEGLSDALSGSIVDTSEEQADGPTTDPSPTEPVAPMSDEDTVLEIIESHDGQVKQSRIVEETEWSKSKVSRVLSRLDEGDTITKINVGRENVITTAGDEPSAVRSPFEE